MLIDFNPDLPDGPITPESLRRFFLNYISANGTAVNMRQAAGKHFGVKPSTISHHVAKLRELLRPRADNLWRGSGGACVKDGSVTAGQILARLESFVEQFGTVWGVKSDTAAHFNIGVPAVNYHLRKLLADPLTAERAKRFVHKKGMNIENSDCSDEN